jgi:uncharacterized membrane protein YjjP (DUF1212 family)
MPNHVLKNKKVATVHGIVLFAGTVVGFTGRYLQFDDIRLTALIPGAIGLLIILLANIRWGKENTRHMIFFIMTLIFGIILTNMALRFIFEDFQPLRKRINFPVMALSSCIAVILMCRNCLADKK